MLILKFILQGQIKVTTMSIIWLLNLLIPSLLGMNIYRFREGLSSEYV